MPEIGELKTVEQESIHIIGVSSGVVRPCSVETAIIRWEGDPYEGPTEITPTVEEQILETSGKTVRQNIVIRAIPSNYGLITWDGHTLTVS